MIKIRPKSRTREIFEDSMIVFIMFMIAGTVTSASLYFFDDYFDFPIFMKATFIGSMSAVAITIIYKLLRKDV